MRDTDLGAGPRFGRGIDSARARWRLEAKQPFLEPIIVLEVDYFGADGLRLRRGPACTLSAARIKL